MQPWMDTIYNEGKKHFYDVFPTLEPGYWSSDYDERKYKSYLFWSQIPPFKYHIAYDLGRTMDTQYLKRYGMTYEDILFPNKMPGSAMQSNAIAGTLNFVSSNLTRLYK